VAGLPADLEPDSPSPFHRAAGGGLWIGGLYVAPEHRVYVLQCMHRAAEELINEILDAGPCTAVMQDRINEHRQGQREISVLLADSN
jgi:hypothetical protein